MPRSSGGRSVLECVRDKTVAIVGRAATLCGSRQGKAIDACDVVVRVNWMLPPEGLPHDIGSRTDVLYYCAGCTGQEAAAQRLGVPSVRVDKALRKRLSSRPGAYRPTTGVVAVFDALESGAAEVRAFGIDFYRTGYAAPAPPWRGKRLPRWRHDRDEDRQLLAGLLRTEPRFRPDPTLRVALEAACV